jgi:hypothetical protein
MSSKPDDRHLTGHADTERVGGVERADGHLVGRVTIAVGASAMPIRLRNASAPERDC